MEWAGGDVGEFRPPETSNRQLLGLLMVIAAVAVTFVVVVGVVGTVVIVARSAVVAAREADAQVLRERQERERVRTQAMQEFERKRQQGSILTLPPEIQPTTLQALITPQGGEVVSADEYRP